MKTTRDLNRQKPGLPKDSHFGHSRRKNPSTFMLKILISIFALLTLGLTAKAPSPATMDLWPADKAPISATTFENAQSTLTIFRPEKPNGTAIVICPGGEYGRVVGAEGAPLSPPCIPPKFVLHGLSARSKFLL